MKLGVLTVLMGDKTLPEVLEYVKKVGIGAVEIGTGNYPGNAHCPLEQLVDNDKARARWKAMLDERDIAISALSCHGNPLHPNADIATAHHEVWRNTVRLANQLGVGTVVTFSGCPGGPGGGTDPIWVTAPWPNEMAETLNWQWRDVVQPYWVEEARFAKEHGVSIAFEMHPNFVVYNPATLLGLRSVAGDNIGANFDPSHLFWQGIDPIEALKALKGCVYHVHAKDCAIDPTNTAVNGVLDTKSYTNEAARSWIFRTVGYGHGAEWWKALVSTLRLIGYDGVLSIEHEDSLMSPNEGLGKAIDFLRPLIINEPPGEAYWA